MSVTMLVYCFEFLKPYTHNAAMRACIVASYAASV